MVANELKRRLPMTADQLRRLDSGALAAVAADLALPDAANLSDEETVERILAHQAWIEQVNPAVLAELFRWAGRRPPQGANPYRMAADAARIRKMAFDDLSMPALRALAHLRGLEAPDDAERDELVRTLKHAENMFDKLRRKRRRFVGKLVATLVGDQPNEEVSAADRAGANLKDQIEEHGLVGGLADKLRGAADDYVALKLDEIEARIDRKLDDIDRRLAEWRDREIANRLRIIKITLVASIIVALISVAYAWIKKTFGL